MNALAEAMEKLRVTGMCVVNTKVRDIFVRTMPLPADEERFLNFDDPIASPLISIVNSALLVRLSPYLAGVNILSFVSDLLFLRLSRRLLLPVLASWR